MEDPPFLPFLKHRTSGKPQQVDPGIVVKLFAAYLKHTSTQDMERMKLEYNDVAKVLKDYCVAYVGQVSDNDLRQLENECEELRRFVDEEKFYAGSKRRKVKRLMTSLFARPLLRRPSFTFVKSTPHNELA
jgi:hypothetical protein